MLISPFSTENGAPCKFRRWQTTKRIASTNAMEDTVKTKGSQDYFVVRTWFRGFIDYSWKKGESKSINKKSLYITAVSLPVGVPYDPTNPNHVKYYNYKHKEPTVFAGRAKHQMVCADIRAGKDIKV